MNPIIKILFHWFPSLFTYVIIDKNKLLIRWSYIVSFEATCERCYFNNMLPPHNPRTIFCKPFFLGICKPKMYFIKPRMKDMLKDMLGKKI
jgi:hypothetical protein